MRTLKTSLFCLSFAAGCLAAPETGSIETPLTGSPCSSPSDCGAGEQCLNGICTVPDGGSGGSIACMTNADCPASTSCVNNSCAPNPTDGGGSPSPPCTSNVQCPQGTYCLNGACNPSTCPAGLTLVCNGQLGSSGVKRQFCVADPAIPTFKYKSTIGPCR